METKIRQEKASRVVLTVILEPKELAKFFRQAFEKVAETLKLDGFRPGKAPYKIVEAAAGYNRLLSEGIDRALHASYPEAIKKNNLIPLSQPEIKVSKSPNFSLDAGEISDNLEYTAEFDVMPEVELEDYSALRVKPPKKSEPKAADVVTILTHLQKQKATFKDIERPAKKGDRVEISFEGFLKKVKIDSMCSNHHPLVLGEGRLIPGFEDEIIGMKKNEEKSFKIKFPKDYHEKNFAGKDAEFKVKLEELKEVVLPLLDDKFAESYGHKKLDKLKDAILDNLKAETDAKYKNDLEIAVIEKVLSNLKVEVPEILIIQETERMIENFRGQIEKNGMNFDKYLENMKKSVEDLRKDMREQAIKNVKIGLMLGKVIQEEKIDSKSPDAGAKALDHLVKTLTA
ncbi:MAG: Trigger factor [bacterium ADurb.BinA186]|nr:MAG: Trigger factor [bacterium ADurb.BinA186]